MFGDVLILFLCMFPRALETERPGCWSWCVVVSLLWVADGGCHKRVPGGSSLFLFNGGLTDLSKV